MIVTEIREEVIINHLFPFLNLNDLLRLRRVCTVFKRLAEDYLRLYTTTPRVIEICADGEDKNLTDFLALNLTVPVSAVYLKNVRSETFESDEIHKFLELYGTKITHLNLCSLEIPITCMKIIEFFESLPNLEYLSIRDVIERIPLESKKNDDQELMIPSTFRRLQTLRIYYYTCSENLGSAQLIWKFIEECSANLEFIYHPLTEGEEGKTIHLNNLPGGRFGGVTRIIEKRSQENPDLPNLKFYDIREFVDIGTDQAMAIEFYKLVTLFFKHNVKLLNVDAALIERMLDLETWDMEDHGKKISNVVQSLHFLYKSSFLLEYPHLEKITIAEEHGILFNCSMPTWEFQRPEWPNLKELKVETDSEYFWEGFYGEEDLKMKVSDLFIYFFRGIRREKMEILDMWFGLNYHSIEKILPFPKIRDVCSSCPNLRKLIIGKWPGSNKAISRIWGNLPLLEYVKFDRCEGLGNLAFIGEDLDNPCFLNATNLRVLELEDLDRMPKITDTLFSRVLCHAPLKGLYLKSVFPVKSVTLTGLTHLLDGVFAETIEDFPLENCLELEKVTKEELVNLQMMFRSSKML